jgi:hypothetical protein
MSAQSPDEPPIHVPSEQFAGTWCNRFKLYRSAHELTLDFMRDDPIRPLSRVVCARVVFATNDV